MRNVSALVLLGMSVPSAVLGADNVDVEALKRELRELRERTGQLERKLEAIQPAAPSANAASVSIPEEAKDLSRSWSPADPIQLGSGSKYLNISLDVLGTVGGSTEEHVEELQLGGHDRVHPHRQPQGPHLHAAP